MNALKIEANIDTPKVYFEPKLNLYLIEGKSLPENALDFYLPILNWLKEFCKEVENINKDYIFNIKLDYYNTASSKQLIQMMIVLSKSAIRDRIKIAWHYDEGDTYSLKAGELMDKLVDLQFEFITSHT